MTDQLRIEVHGKDPMTGAVLAAAATIKLLGTLMEEIAPDSGLRWSVGQMCWKCDGCGRETTERPDTWTNDGTDDFCEECSEKR